MPTDTQPALDVRTGIRRALQRGLVHVSLRVAVGRWFASLVLLGALWISLFGVGSGGNLALGKPVTTSGSCTQRPDYSWAPVHPSRLVDGKTWRPYDACTEKTLQPWMTIDLMQRVRLDEVVVTGRRDCCWGWRDLPLLLELSSDGTQFHTVAQRDLPLSDRHPWRVEMSGTEGRFLRLRVSSNTPSEIALKEVEVFGTALP